MSGSTSAFPSKKTGTLSGRILLHKNSLIAHKHPRRPNTHANSARTRSATANASWKQPGSPSPGMESRPLDDIRRRDVATRSSPLLNASFHRPRGRETLILPAVDTVPGGSKHLMEGARGRIRGSYPHCRLAPEERAAMHFTPLREGASGADVSAVSMPRNGAIAPCKRAFRKSAAPRFAYSSRENGSALTSCCVPAESSRRNGRRATAVPALESGIAALLGGDSKRSMQPRTRF